MDMNKELKLCVCGCKPKTVCTNSENVLIRGRGVDVVRCDNCTMQSEEFLCDIDSLDKAIDSWNHGKTYRPDIYSGGRWWTWEEYQEFMQEINKIMMKN